MKHVRCMELKFFGIFWGILEFFWTFWTFFGIYGTFWEFSGNRQITFLKVNWLLTFSKPSDRLNFQKSAD